MPDRLDRLLAKAGMLAAPEGVAIAIVRWRDLRCFPEKLVVKTQQHAILWVTDAETIHIDPIPGLAITHDGTYASADPAAAPIPDTKYSGTLTKGTQTKVFDPRLEVVP